MKRPREACRAISGLTPKGSAASGPPRLVEAVPDGVPGHWRVQFDLADVQGAEPVELRLQLTVGGVVATETWMFQYHPDGV